MEERLTINSQNLGFQLPVHFTPNFSTDVLEWTSNLDPIGLHPFNKLVFQL